MPSKPARTIIALVALWTIAALLPSPGLCIDHFWTGAVSTDAADPRNWYNGTADPTLPSDNDIVRIGCTPDWQYIVHANQPVLTSEWVSRQGTAGAGWWLILGSPENGLTIGEGAYIEWSHNDCTLRNGSYLRVTGQRAGGGPSLVIAPRFRIGNNGDVVPTATSRIIVEKNGYLRLDPAVSRKGSGGWQVYMGPATKALIEIRDNGILELAPNADMTVVPRFVFASADPEQNKIVISGNGQLILSGNPDAIAQVAGADTSLQKLIEMGLISSGDPDVPLQFSGTNPTIVKLVGLRISNPRPADGDADLDRDIQLAWDPGTLADSYDVYLGTDPDVVAQATRANPMGALVSQGQTQTFYPVDGTLALQYGKRYYWRVDEVGAKILKGRIWSFAVEPYAIPIPANSIIATASSSQSPDQGPEKTIDGSGLDPNGLHSTSINDMWLSATPAPVWIQYDFDRIYKLDRMLVWNYNGEDLLAGLGCRDVTIEYSLDDADWIALANIPAFEPALGQAGYAANTIVDLADIAAQKVRITALSNWANNPLFGMCGLSEVRFLYVPVTARALQPHPGAIDVPLDATLIWRPGREASQHLVYLATDQQAVADAAVQAVAVQKASYSPDSLLLGTTYFWRVDEVNQAQTPSVWPGQVWSFTTLDYLVVDDFESYTNNSPKRVFQTWIDGIGFSADQFFPSGHPGNGTGAVVGYDPALGNIMETRIVHGGRQSMPLSYDGLSETTRTFQPAQDWTKHGITTLVLFFRGELTNTPGELYVKINGVKVSYTGASTDLASDQWRQWNIALPANAGLNAVTTLTIGISSGNGILYIDDIRLYSSAQVANP
ncbi:MAG: discoidin domain-containing protein [Sedimentisphaerales bacterium]|jgi:hypothetical protein|nr:discoidin domain-containing protein [Sedimentisphaerales bacterium]